MSRFHFTKEALDALPLPEKGQRTTYYDSEQPGLQIRVTSAGVKTFSVFARVAGGAPERVTIGKYPTINVKQARTKAKKIVSDLALGESPMAAKRVKKVESLTLAEAVAEYVRDKRRRDGLPLKQRTVTDYLKKVLPAKAKVNGSQKMPGELFALADKPIRSITGADIRKVHAANLLRGERAAFYAMQVLRAVLSWHEVTIPDTPFGKDKAGKKAGITIPKAHATGTIIPPEQIGKWWNAINSMPVEPATDYLRFLLLTGCRPAEPLKVLVSDCDLVGGRVTLRDTKNRQDHLIRLSTQCWEIVKRQTEGKLPGDRLFTMDPKKTIQALVKTTGITFTPKTLRSTFASAAEVLVSAYTLKRMMNHIQSSDVTGVHYIHKGEVELRAGWQSVADFIEGQATTNVVPIRGAAS